MTYDVDQKVFAELIKAACEAAVNDYRTHPAEEISHRAFARLDGILEATGALIEASGKGDKHDPLLELVRDLTQQHQSAIIRLLQENEERAPNPEDF